MPEDFFNYRFFLQLTYWYVKFVEKVNRRSVVQFPLDCVISFLIKFEKEKIKYNFLSHYEYICKLFSLVLSFLLHNSVSLILINTEMKIYNSVLLLYIFFYHFLFFSHDSLSKLWCGLLLCAESVSLGFSKAPFVYINIVFYEKLIYLDDHIPTSFGVEWLYFVRKLISGIWWNGIIIL